MNDRDKDKIFNPDKKTSKTKCRKIILILLFLIFMLILIITLHDLGYIKYPWDKSGKAVISNFFPDLGDDVEKGHLSNMTPEQIIQQMQREADASQFSFKINASPVFETGSSKGNLRIENPNHNIYPMVVQIVLDDSEETIYDSGGILPDHHIDEAKLTKTLEKGSYSAKAYINAYDPDTKEYQGKSIVQLLITIKK